jgi:hypothetical protein
MLMTLEWLKTNKKQALFTKLSEQTGEEHVVVAVNATHVQLEL